MKTKKLFSMLLTLTMVINLISVLTLTVGAAAITPSQPSLGDGTDSNPYKIGTAAELYWFATQVNSGNTTICGKLTANITVNETVLNADGSLVSSTSSLVAWTPIGNKTHKYTGTFDGDNYTISGLYLDAYTSSATAATDANKCIGLFGYCENGNLKNLTVKDSFFGGYQDVGGIVGTLWDSKASMENCTSYATVKGHQSVGGIVGATSYASLNNCHNHGFVMAANNFGGFVGNMSADVKISNSSNTGRVQRIAHTSACQMGGFAGYCSNSKLATITNCFNTGDVTFTAIRSSSALTHIIGGFAGSVSANYENCYSTGTITLVDLQEKDTHRIGAFSGTTLGANYFSYANCYFDNQKCEYGAVKDAEHDNITGKSTAQFASGEVAYLLNGSKSTDEVVWKQALATDATPNFDGLIVYNDGTKYYNIIPELTLTLTTSGVTIENLSESAILIVASYNGSQFVDAKTVPVSAGGTTTIASTGLTLTGANTIKAFLWKDMSGFVPLCESDFVAYGN